MKKIFYGWFVVFACFLLMATGWGMVYNTASLFLVPISEELGLLRSEISFTMTLRSLVQMLTSLFAGRIFRRFSILGIMKVMSLVLVVNYILFGFASQLWQIYVLTLIGALANAFIGVVPLSVIIGNWFQEKRGSALGFAFMGSGVGGMLYSSLTGKWILNYGWQRSYQLQALVMFLIIVPTVFILMKEKPEDMGLSALGKEREIEEDGGISFEKAKKIPFFWMTAIMSAVANFSINMSMISIAPHLVDIGYNFSFAANILALTMASLAIGKLLLGHLLDRLGLRWAISISVGGSILSMLGLLFGQYKPALLLVILGAGIGSAHGTMVDPFLTRTIFGKKDYSSIYGFLAAFASFGSMFSPIVHGLSYDISGSYHWILLQMCFIIFGLLVADQWLFSRKNLDRVRMHWEE